MAVAYNPKVYTDGLIFYVDGRNSKSFFDSTLKSLFSSEQKQANVLLEDGFINTDYKTIEKFEDFDISGLDAITINLLINHEQGKTGFAFSINSEDLAVNTPSDQTLYTTSPVNTDATIADTYDPNYSATGQTSYTTSESSTLALNADTFTPNYSTSTQTSYTTSDSSTLATITDTFDLSYPATTQTSYTTSESSTTAISINSLYDIFQNELSFYSNNTEVIIKNKSSDYESILNYESPLNSSAVYSVIFKPFSGTNNPISLYQNGVMVSSSDPVIGSSSSFQNLGISLFNKNDSDYSQYGVRFVSIYNKALSQLEAQTINKIQPIR